MINRPFWRQKITDSWTNAPIVWLTGVRRAGKTTLCHGFPDACFLNCDLPSTVQLLQDPEAFFDSVTEKILIFDEIHQLPNPSQILKIGADAYPKLRILATGSSTLAATRKFRDSLTGRKRTIHLTPVLAEELSLFNHATLDTRLLRGGLPQVLLSGKSDPEFYSEWLDSYFARDVQELFHVEKRNAFLLLQATVMRQSGGMLDVTALSKICGISRPTTQNYLDVLQITHVAHIIRPYHDGGKQELVKQPRVYGFDTGFVAFCRGWGELRAEDRGTLWEHLVLDTLLSIFPANTIHYWRTKQQREIDFVISRQRGHCDTIECKWNVDAFEPKNLIAFRNDYPRGKNYIVAPSIKGLPQKTISGHTAHFVNPAQLRSLLDKGNSNK